MSTPNRGSLLIPTHCDRCQTYLSYGTVVWDLVDEEGFGGEETYCTLDCLWGLTPGDLTGVPREG